MIVLEPNGNNLLRKAMEYTPSYRDAGEDSFRSKDLMAIFTAAGWRTEIWRRLNLFPNFTPGFLYRWLARSSRASKAALSGTHCARLTCTA